MHSADWFADLGHKAGSIPERAAKESPQRRFTQIYSDVTEVQPWHMLECTRKFVERIPQSLPTRARPPQRNRVLDWDLFPGPDQAKVSKSLSGSASLNLYTLHAHHPLPFARSLVQWREKPLRLATERSKRAACFSNARTESHPPRIHSVSKLAPVLRNH